MPKSTEAEMYTSPAKKTFTGSPFPRAVLTCLGALGPPVWN